MCAAGPVLKIRMLPELKTEAVLLWGCGVSICTLVSAGSILLGAVVCMYQFATRGQTLGSVCSGFALAQVDAGCPGVRTRAGAFLTLVWALLMPFLTVFDFIECVNRRAFLVPLLPLPLHLLLMITMLQLRLSSPLLLSVLLLRGSDTVVPQPAPTVFGRYAPSSWLLI
jgi:hypothetical protein